MPVPAAPSIVIHRCSTGDRARPGEGPAKGGKLSSVGLTVIRENEFHRSRMRSDALSTESLIITGLIAPVTVFRRQSARRAAKVAYCHVLSSPSRRAILPSALDPLPANRKLARTGSREVQRTAVGPSARLSTASTARQPIAAPTRSAQ